MNDSPDVGMPPSGPEPCSAPQRGDESLFGPDSVTWRVHAEPLMGLAGLRAILLQALHPVVIDAIDQHSGYRDDPWGRLHRFTEFVGMTTYGSAAAAMLHGSRVRAVHARIRGRTAAGVEYTADDPQLLAWVHCCFVASFLEIVTRAGARLSGADQDAYVAEQVRSAMLVGLEPDEVPHDRAGLLDYFRVIRPLLDCSPGARRAAELVVQESAGLRSCGPLGIADADAAPDGDAALSAGTATATASPGATAAPRASAPASGSPRPSWAPVAGLAFSALPPWARRLYALPHLPGAAGLGDQATTAALRSLRSWMELRAAAEPDRSPGRAGGAPV